MPDWVLPFTYWLHMVATVVWIGGLFFHSVVLTPVLLQSVPDESLPRLLRTLRRRFDPLAWLSLAVLTATGLTQMAANPNYEGFLAVSNPWAAAILAKHLAILLMVLAASYQSWALQPRLDRLILLQAKKRASHEEALPELKRLARLTRLNLLLGMLVLALTAVARTS